MVPCMGRKKRQLSLCGGEGFGRDDARVNERQLPRSSKTDLEVPLPARTVSAILSRAVHRGQRIRPNLRLFHNPPAPVVVSWRRDLSSLSTAPEDRIPSSMTRQPHIPPIRTISSLTGARSASIWGIENPENGRVDEAPASDSAYKSLFSNDLSGSCLSRYKARA